MTGSHHERLAGLMDERRLELDMKWEEVAAAAGIKPPTLRAIRNGTNSPSPLTMRGLDRALRWEPGSVERTLAGGEPVPSGQARGHRSDVPTDEELRQSGLQPETIDALLAMRRRIERWAESGDETQIKRANRIIEAMDDAEDAG